MDTDHFRLILLILSELSPPKWNLAKSIYEVGSELTINQATVLQLGAYAESVPLC